MHIAKTFAAFAFAAALLTGAAQAQTEIKFGHVGEPGSLFDAQRRNSPSAPTPSSATRPKSWSTARVSLAATPN